MKKILFFYNKILSTFWFIPVLIIGVSIFLAFALLILDTQVNLTVAGVWQYLFISGAESAYTILSTIATAMIGVAGTVFSITLVALTLASSQLGPRQIKKFMYDRINQVVLGAYIATFVYCLLVLNTMHDYEEMKFVPSFSILFAQVSAVSNIILLIVFMHHISVSIQADVVISDISDDLIKQIDALFPQTEQKVLEKVDEEDIRSSYIESVPLKAHKSGYLQYINLEPIVNKVKDMDGLLVLHIHAGAYLVENIEIGQLYFNQINSETKTGLKGELIVGSTRSHQQDIEYSIHQLSEMALRALSSGINDPYTAISCLDKLSNALSKIATLQFPSPYCFDENGDLRVIRKTDTYEGLMDAAFNQIRQNSTNSPAVVIRLMEALITIKQFAVTANHHSAVEKHAVMVLNMAKREFNEPNDLKDLEQRYKKLGAVN